MAKKKEKGKKKKDAAAPRDAVRTAVEGTFKRAAGGVQELLDEVTALVARLREANVVEGLDDLRKEVRALNERVAALEALPKRPARKAPAKRTPAKRTPAKRTPAKPPASRRAPATPKPPTRGTA